MLYNYNEKAYQEILESVRKGDENKKYKRLKKLNERRDMLKRDLDLYIKEIEQTEQLIIDIANITPAKSNVLQFTPKVSFHPSTLNF